MVRGVLASFGIILIDVFNLAEQFGIYFIAKEASLDESAQQRFFFVLLGIGGALTIRPMLLSSKLKIIFSVLIEIGELICYLILLPRTTNLIIVASVFFVIEVLLHVITFFIMRWNFDEIECKTCVWEYLFFPVRALAYGFLYSSPILFLFLDPNSKFRDTFYEVLLILNVFLGAGYIEQNFAPRNAFESEYDDDDEMIYRIWQCITVVIYNILALIILVTTMVFAGQAINKHATGEHILNQYDFGVYIYCLVNYGLLAYGQVLSCWSLCIRLSLGRNS